MRLLTPKERTGLQGTYVQVGLWLSDEGLIWVADRKGQAFHVFLDGTRAYMNEFFSEAADFCEHVASVTRFGSGRCVYVRFLLGQKSVLGRAEQAWPGNYHAGSNFSGGRAAVSMGRFASHILHGGKLAYKLQPKGKRNVRVGGYSEGLASAVQEETEGGYHIGLDGQEAYSKRWRTVGDVHHGTAPAQFGFVPKGMELQVEEPIETDWCFINPANNGQPINEARFTTVFDFNPITGLWSVQLLDGTLADIDPWFFS